MKTNERQKKYERKVLQSQLSEKLKPEMFIAFVSKEVG